MTALLLLLAPVAPAAPVEVAPMPAVVPDAAQLAAWLADLSSKDQAKQLAARDRLVRAGSRARSLVPDLVRLLHADYPVPCHAADVLAAIGPDAADAVPELLAACKPGFGGFLNANFALALARIDRPRPEATYALLMSSSKGNSILLNGSDYLRDYPAQIVPHLVELCSHKDAGVRRNAVTVLAGLDYHWGHELYTLLQRAGDGARGVPAVLEKLLADEDAQVRVLAGRAIAHVAPDLAEKSVPVVVAILSDPKGGEVMNSYTAAEILRPVPEKAAAALVPLFDSADDRVRGAAAGTLAELPVRETVEGVLRTGKTARARESAALCLGAARSDKNSVAALRAALADEALVVRFAAAKSLVNVTARGSEDSAAVPALVEGLRGGTATTKIEAAEYLVRVGAPAKSAVPALKAALADKDGGVALEAALALAAIAPADAAPAAPVLVAALKDDGGDAFRAAAVLAALGPVAKDAVPELLKKFDSKNLSLRVAAAEAAARIDPAQAEKATGVLVPLVSAREHRFGIREEAALALARIGPAAKSAAPALLPLLKEKGPFRAHLALAAIAVDRDGSKAATDWLREQLATEGPDAGDAAEALVELGPAAKPFVPELVLMLGSKTEYVREDAARALGAIGPAAKDALPALKAVAEGDKVATARRLAAAAVKKIEGK